MKKVTGFLMMAALLIGFAACNNEDVPEVEQNQEGDSFAGLTISTRSASGTRAQNDEGGREAESTVAQIDLLSSASAKTWTSLTTLPTTYQVDANEFYDLSGGKFTVSPWSTTDGTHNMALLLNGASLASKGTIANASGLVVNDAVSILAAENAFTMSSKTFSGNVLPGISAATIATSTNTANVFNQDVERVVAQGIVVNGTSSLNTTDSTGTLSDLTYGGAMGATETYLYADHAGDRTMTGTPENYAGYTSAVHGVAIETTEPSTNAKFAKAEATSLTLAAAASPFAARGFYFLENSMALPESNFDWKYSRSAYAKIYGIFTPAVVYEQVGETNTLSENSAFVAGTTFYKGEKDGLFYATAAAAELSPSFPGQSSYMYKGGRVVYRSLWNRVSAVVDGNIQTLNGNTRRNNIYVLNVTAFAKIGMNYDPNDPTDPNIPKPTNTDEPTTPLDGGDPTVDKQDTYMTITSTILPWNKVGRDVILQ